MAFSKKLISAAVLSAIGATSAQATYLSEDGTGQVLLYPYYTVRNGTDTYVSVVNTTNRAKALKVRILEGKNSKEVLDFNLYLSKYDVWTAAITTDASGNPILRVADKSCTAPIRVSGINGVHDEPFRNVLFTETGKNSAGVSVTAPATLDRATEGYLEIIEMGNITLSATPGTSLAKTGGGNIQFEAAVTHTGAGVPADCPAVENAWNDGTFPAVTDFDSTTGGLIGTGTLINVAAGTDYSYDPVALKAFAALPLAHSIPGTEAPSLSDGDTVSTVINNVGVAVIDNWTDPNALGTGAGGASATGAAAVSAVLTRQAVMNEYIINPAIAAGTDWVVNFPTRRFHISDAPPAAAWSYRPFRRGFLDDLSNVCERVSWSYYGQEEEQVTGGIDVSPMPPAGTHQLCWEVNVVTFKGSDVLKSANKYDLTSIAYNAGWARLGLSVAGGGTFAGEPEDNYHYILADGATPADIYRGLPTIGFAVQRYTNGNVGGVLSNYGGSFIHKYTNAF